MMMKPALYRWLIKYDKQWLNSSSPSRRFSSGPPSLVDWKQRDLDLAIAAQKLAQDIKLTPGRPIWASKKRIAKEIGVLAMLTIRSYLISHTIETLERVSETATEFAIRRIEWAANLIQHERSLATYSKIKKRACISDGMNLKPEIIKKILEVLEEIKITSELIKD